MDKSSELIGSGILMVSFDFTGGKDKSFALVGTKSKAGLSILKTFKGQEAEDLYLKLTQQEVENVET